MTDPKAFSYAVVRMGDEWKVVCARNAMGHFARRDEALIAASALAAQAAAAGHAAEVLVQSDSGELRQAWQG
ncbi:MAG: hypothetical protein Q7J28_02530 [Caulobacter sp.]|nr:hypothetical protein [Caulobacter sp.]